MWGCLRGCTTYSWMWCSWNSTLNFRTCRYVASLSQLVRTSIKIWRRSSFLFVCGWYKHSYLRGPPGSIVLRSRGCFKWKNGLIKIFNCQCERTKCMPKVYTQTRFNRNLTRDGITMSRNLEIITKYIYAFYKKLDTQISFTTTSYVQCCNVECSMDSKMA